MSTLVIFSDFFFSDFIKEEFANKFLSSLTILSLKGCCSRTDSGIHTEENLLQVFGCPKSGLFLISGPVNKWKLALLELLGLLGLVCKM